MPTHIRWLFGLAVLLLGVSGVPAQMQKLGLHVPPPESHSFNPPHVDFSPEALASVTNDPFWHLPNQAALRNVEQNKALCLSPSFDLTQENWVSALPELWLANFTKENYNTQYYQVHGLLASIAHQYIGDGDYRCGIAATSCSMDCMDAVERIDDIDEARIVYFILKNAEHLSGVYSHFWDLITNAQLDVDETTAQIATDLFWSHPSSNQIIFDQVISYVNMFAQILTSTISTYFTLGFAIQMAQKSFNKAYTDHALLSKHLEESKDLELGSGLQQMQVQVERSAEAVKKTGEFTTQLTNIKNKADHAEKTFWYTTFVSPLISILRPSSLVNKLMSKVKYESPETPVDMNKMKIEHVNAMLAQQARQMVSKGMQDFWEGRDATETGASTFLAIMAGGTYLDPRGRMMTEFNDMYSEARVTQMLRMRVINWALKSQQLWISCSGEYSIPGQIVPDYRLVADSPLEACRKDNSGPPELKGCVDGGQQVCYMYRWNARKMQFAQRVEYPFGYKRLPYPPYNIPIEAIILSSYKTHMARRKHGWQVGAPEPIGMLDEPMVLNDDLWNPAAVNAFSLPVCLSGYNWQTPIGGSFQEFKCDPHSHCSKKRLPCFCGPWGNETQVVMEQARLWDSGFVDEYRGRRCPLQQEDIIKDPLERFVAKCRTDKESDKSNRCDVVLMSIEQGGWEGPNAIPASEKTKLECFAELHSQEYCKQWTSVKTTKRGLAELKSWLID